MKKTSTNKTFHPGSTGFLIALVLLLSGGNNLQAQPDEQSRQEISADRWFSGEELRKTNPVNLWEAIKLLEPSLTEKGEE
ncbi:MAG: hypothetical protein K2I90_04090, partial [Odoribacter sp.]|nr:hypothetical protein [Odoribacter sp.]